MSRWKWNAALAMTVIAGLTVLTACGGKAQTTGTQGGKKIDFPTKPISLIVPFAAGGGTDTTARALAKSAEKILKQPITVVNKTGGGGSVGMTEGSNAKNDGYTVTVITVELTTLSHLGLSPITYQNFKPIAMMNYEPAAITVRSDSQWKTMKEFLDYAKANPGQLKLGNSGTGAIWHLAAAALEKGTGTKYNHIPFEGAAPAISALLGGHVDAVPVSPPEVKSQVESGKLRALAVLDDKPAEVLAGVKTLKEETGIEFSYIGTWRGLGVPKDTPDEIVQLLSDAFMKGMEDAEFKEFMKKNELTIVAKDSKSFGQYLKENHDKFGKLIPELGLSKK
ncbi:tripartite tricarboxylate transporter substrate binding protein [Paenibacillus hamazuiensis]|uniref:tripartite tricarboxylate transporter substrate binding protein n=1 Tax=Paenibacillus hamazuiensis TaxID=2936508 RepID=UPI00200C90D3|nr:tripartite tricarboxylate transporter substrate binding protein [Paenibacillus hamazuiensis]